MNQLNSLLLLLFFSMQALAMEGEADVVKESVNNIVSPVIGIDVAKIVLTLVFIIALIIGVVLFLKRFTPYGNTGRDGMRVITGISVGSRERILLIQVGSDTQLLVGVTPTNISKLHVMDELLDFKSDGQANEQLEGRFSERLMQAIKQSK